MSAMFQFNNQDIRQKYLDMVQSDGLDKAVSHLHNLVGDLEPRIYDGGYEPERLEKVQFLRGLARELWAMRLDPKVRT